MNYDRDYLDSMDIQYDHSSKKYCDYCWHKFDEVVQVGEYNLCPKCHQKELKKIRAIICELDDCEMELMRKEIE